MKEYSYEEVNLGRSGETLIAALDKIDVLNKKLDLALEALNFINRMQKSPYVEKVLTQIENLD